MEFILNRNDNLILKKMLLVEHENVASKLGLINRVPSDIEDEELPDIIGLIDDLSREKDEKAQKLTTLLCALLWNYKKSNWNGLREFFLIILSRIGLSPTAIMVDDEYDYESKLHFRLNSLFSEMSVALNKMQYEVTVGLENFSLTKFQKNVWDKIDGNKIVGISAPTSAGKSFVILLKSIEILLENKGILVYIVPNLSLVSQVSTDFRALLKKFDMNEYRILNTYNSERNEQERVIYVLTQERAIGAFANEENPFKNLRLLVVDEIQNIERASSENEERSKILYDTLTEFRINAKPEKIIISGPRINNIEELAEELFGEEAEQQETLQSPVVNLTYAIYKNDQGYYLRQYSDVLEEPNSIPLYNSEEIKGIGQVRYTEPFHNYLKFILNGLGKNSINIIFSPNPNQSRKTALAIKDEYPEINGKELNDLIKYIEYSVHPKYDLVDTLQRGVAYHNGRLPHHVRRVVERAINDRIINNIVCTTTLMQGVNLPAQNVIIRNPNLFIQNRENNSPKLSNYEFANLRGRAGRLLKDFIGRTYILDEASFEHDEVEQAVFFEDSHKELNAGYSVRFNENKQTILRCLLENKTPSSEIKHAYFLPYIRNCILRYGVDAKKNLGKVGITIPETIFNAVRISLNALTIPLEICIKNRYWDPLVLESLYKKRNKFKLPNTIFHPNLVNELIEVIVFMRKEYYYYFEKHLNVENDSLIYSMCINAEQWLQEIPLSKILNTSYHINSEKIDSTINTLQNTISYKLPALLKPLYDIKHPESNILSFIEMGAYRIKTRKLIEMGVPRETAIEIATYFLDGLSENDEELEKRIIQRIRKERNSFPYWIKVQLESIL